jgi:hypothetical protein
MQRTVRAVLSAAVAAVAVSLGMPSAAAADTGLLRLAHLSPDTPAVDVYVDSVSDPAARLTVPGVSYGTVSDHRQLPAGIYTVAMRAAGAAPTTPPVLSTTVQVTANSARTVAGVGHFSALGLTVLDDDLAPPPPGRARMRVVAAAATAPKVDVSIAGGPSAATALPFGKAGGYVDAPGGPTSLTVTPSGGAPTRLPVPLAAGSVYSVLLLDRPGGGLTVRPVLDAAGTGAMPVGGVATGAGGTAGRPPAAVVAAVSTGVAVAAVAGLLLTLCPRVPRSRGLRRGSRTARWRLAAVLTRRARDRRHSRRRAVRLALTAIVVVACGTAVLAHSVTAPGPATARRPGTVVVAAATTTAAASTPTSVRVPAVGISSGLVPLGVDAAGALVPPSDFGRAGWFAGGPLPGAVGPAVIAGHVDSPAGPAVFFRLRDVVAGDDVLVGRADGSTARFTVTRVTRVAKSAFPTTDVYGPTPDAQLRLVTCGGAFDHSARSYVDDVVVFARLAT